MQIVEKAAKRFWGIGFHDTYPDTVSGVSLIKNKGSLLAECELTKAQ